MSRTRWLAAALIVGGVNVIFGQQLPFEKPIEPARLNPNSVSANPAAQDNSQSPSAPSEVAGKYAAKRGFDVDGNRLPPGVVARLGTARYRPGKEKGFNEIDPIKFLADNTTLVQVTGDGWLQYRDVTSGALTKQFKVSEEPVSSAAVAEAASRIAIGGWRDNSTSWFKLIDSDNDKQLVAWEVVENRSTKLALSADGRFVAWGRETIHVFDAQQQKEAASRPGQQADIESLTFTPDGQTLAIGMRGKLMLWNWSGKDEPQQLTIVGNPRRSPGIIGAVAFSRDGSQVAVPPDNTTGISLYDVAAGAHVRTYLLPNVTLWYPKALSFSPDGKLLAAPIDDLNYGGGIALWDVATGQLVRRLKGLRGTANGIAFSSDGRWLTATSSLESPAMCVWDLATGEPQGADLPGHKGPPALLRFFNDDKQLATAGDDGTLRIWNLADSRQLRVIQHEPDSRGSMKRIRAMDVSPNGSYVATSSMDDSVRLWETATGKEIYRLPGHGRLGGWRALRFTPDSKQLISWGDDMHVYSWDVATGMAVNEYTLKPDGLDVKAQRDGGAFLGGPIMQIAGGCGLSSDASTLYVSLNGFRLYSVATGREYSILDVQHAPGSQIVVSPDMQYVIAAGAAKAQQVPLANGAVRAVAANSHPVLLWSVADKKVVGQFESTGRGTDHTAFSRDGRLVAISIDDDHPRVELRTVPDLAEAGTFELTARARGIEFSDSGKLLAVSMEDATVLLWDLEHLLRNGGRQAAGSGQ